MVFYFYLFRHNYLIYHIYLLIISIFFARQGLSGPYQMSEKKKKKKKLSVISQF